MYLSTMSQTYSDETYLRPQLEQTEQKIELLRSEFEKINLIPMRAEIFALRNELVRVRRKERSGTKRRHMDAIKRLTDKIERENSSVAEISLKIDSLKQKIASYIVEEQSLEKDTRKTEQLIHECEQKFIDVKRDKKRLEIEVHELEESNESRLFMSGKTQKDTDRLRSDKGTLSNSLQKRSHSCERLEESISFIQSLIQLRRERLGRTRQALVELGNEEEKEIANAKDMNESITELQDMREMRRNLEKKVFQVKAEVARITREIEVPKNMHSMRKLESSDPETFCLADKLRRMKLTLNAKRIEISMYRKKILEAGESEVNHNQAQARFSQAETFGNPLEQVHPHALANVSEEMESLESKLESIRRENVSVLEQLERLNAEKTEFTSKLIASKRVEPALATDPIESARGCRLKYAGGGFCFTCIR